MWGLLTISVWKSPNLVLTSGRRGGLFDSNQAFESTSVFPDIIFLEKVHHETIQSVAVVAY